MVNIKLVVRFERFSRDYAVVFFFWVIFFVVNVDDTWKLCLTFVRDATLFFFW